MLGEARALLVEAVEYFDAHEKYSVDSLLARCTLAKVYEKSGDKVRHTVTMVTTYKLFKHRLKYDNTILTSPRSKNILTRFVENVEKAGLANYEGLR